MLVISEIMNLMATYFNVCTVGDSVWEVLVDHDEYWSDTGDGFPVIRFVGEMCHLEDEAVLDD